MFADDIARVNDTIISLQRQINLIESFCESVGMTLNLLKTKVIVICNGDIVLGKQKNGTTGDK